MYKFIHRLIEIKNILDHLWFIETILDIAIILLAGFIFIKYTGMIPFMIIIPIFIYILISIKYKFNKNTVALIEKKYPELNERLRTVYDNRDNKNIVLEDLAASVLADIEKIKFSSFFETRMLGVRIAIILLLVTFMISSLFYPLFFNMKTDKEMEIPSPIPESSENIKTGENIFEEPSYVNIANNSEDLTVNRGSGSELNVPGTENKPQAIHPAFPKDEDIAIASSQAYSETIPVIYQKIVKNYFMNITRE